jgi:Protein of unknown function (DUF3592)
LTIFFLLILGILGLGLVFLGLSWFVISIRRHPHLLRISGTVVSVEEKFDRVDDNVTFFPTIAYTAPEGNQVRFRSRTGVTREVRRLSGPNISPWRDGQAIDVFHDASGVLEPSIASLWSLYGWPAGFLVGGILLLTVVVNKWNQLGGQ